MSFVKRRLRNVKPRVMENADGKLWKRCDVKVIIQGKIQPHKFVAPAGRGYSEKDIEEIQEKCIDYLDKRFPHFEFKEVRIAPNAFNYIATGLRGGQSPQEFMNEQSQRLDPEAFVASVRAAANKSNDKNSGADAAAGAAKDSCGEPTSGEPTTDSSDRQEAADGSDSNSGVQESGPQDRRDQIGADNAAPAPGDAASTE